MFSFLVKPSFCFFIFIFYALISSSTLFAAPKSCLNPVTSSTETAGCACEASAGRAYKYKEDGTRDVVYWTVTNIPTKLSDPAPHANMNGIGSLVSPSVAGQACEPKCTVSVENMTIKTPSASGSGCDAVYEITGCAVPGTPARACITTTTTAKNGTASRTDCVMFTGGGEWVGGESHYCAPDWCGPVGPRNYNSSSATREMGYRTGVFHYISGPDCALEGALANYTNQLRPIDDPVMAAQGWEYAGSGCWGFNSVVLAYQRWWTEKYVCK